MNTYGLIRISSHIQSEKNGGTGLKFQSNRIKQYAHLHNLTLIKIISDTCSGGLETREGIEELKSVIKSSGCDTILIWNTSRAFRSLVAFSKFYAFIQKHNCTLISVSEGISSKDKTGEMLFGIMCSIATHEKTIITERMMSGKMVKCEEGIRAFGGKLPFAYRRNYDGEIVIDESDGKVVQYIFRKLNQLNKKNISKTKKTQRLLKLLKRNGYTFRGKSFQNHHIHTIVSNHFYYGRLNYNGYSTKHNHPQLISKRLYNSVSSYY